MDLVGLDCVFCSSCLISYASPHPYYPVHLLSLPSRMLLSKVHNKCWRNNEHYFSSTSRSQFPTCYPMTMWTPTVPSLFAHRRPVLGPLGGEMLPRDPHWETLPHQQGPHPLCMGLCSDFPLPPFLRRRVGEDMFKLSPRS